VIGLVVEFNKKRYKNICIMKIRELMNLLSILLIIGKYNYNS